MNVKNDPGVLFLFTQVAFSTVNIHVNANKHHVDLFLFTKVLFPTGELPKLCPVICFLPGDSLNQL